MRKSNKELMGDLAEDIFFEKMNGEKNEDRWDPNGDGLLNKNIAEVKAQNRHPAGYMTINNKASNQVRKCMDPNVRLFFIEYDETPNAKVREVIDKNSYTILHTRDGREMRGWSISKMKHIDEWEGVGDQLKIYSSAKQFRKKQFTNA